MKRSLLATSFFILACSSGPCKEQRLEAERQKAPEAAIPMNEVKPTDRVKVYKADGSLQCGQGKAIPVEQMKKELQGITVFSSENKMDGLMHIQACGTPTGKSNVYEISRNDLEKAKKLGFREWTFD